MGRISIAAFKPKPGKEADLLAITEDHLPILRSQGLATDRPHIVCKAADGTIIEAFEWVSDEAIEKAHSNPEVHKLWQRYFDACDSVTLDQLPEAKGPFPTFDAVN